MILIILPWMTGMMVIAFWDEILEVMVGMVVTGWWVECEFSEIQLSEGSQSQFSKWIWISEERSWIEN